MDYYKLRSTIMQRLKDHLTERDRLFEQGLQQPPFKDFRRKLMLEYGVTESMITKMVETLVPGGTVLKGEIVKK